ncbi:hypothetical protein AYK24_03435 [Thermoplasmatales archaeon SG8-52-4]|nr:MAG: hypothetical protein AYK24_03435 [Thermoplasmatales archaeon SG8-52-4]
MRLIKSIILIFILFIIVNIFPASNVISKENEYKPTGRFVNLQSYLSWDFNNSALKEPIVPIRVKRSVTIYFDYGVNYAGRFKNLAKLLLQYYRGKQVNIRLEITDHPPWCTPTLFNDVITTVVGGAEQTGLQATLELILDLEAPAYASGFVTVKATVPDIGLIQGYSTTHTLEFLPAYLPLIKSQVKGSNCMRIEPMDTAVFQIEIENLGNGRTKVILQVLSESVPDGWIATVTEEIYLDVGKNSKGIAYLTVKPPKSSGYHDDTAGITIEMAPHHAEDSNDKGNAERISVLVESRGIIGTEEKGFEIDTTYLLILIIIILIIIIIAIQLKNIKR